MDSTPKTTATHHHYEICMSPGCVADGADRLLSKMKALAPLDVSVKPGGCVSLCGNGPIVLDGNNKKNRKVSDKKLVELLFGEGGMTSEQQAVFDAFDVVSEAGDRLEQKDYEKAAEMYGKGIDMGLEAALSLGAPSDGDGPPSEGLRWLVDARNAEAAAKLNLRDADGAIESAESARELSKDSSLPALELLQESYAAKGDPEAELKALRTYFGLPEPEKMTTMQANKRRNLGFRLQKLEREAE